MFQLWQLYTNEKYPNLRSWQIVRDFEKLPDIINPEVRENSDIFDDLEIDFCYEDCLHEFKITDGGLKGRIVFHSNMLRLV